MAKKKVAAAKTVSKSEAKRKAIQKGETEKPEKSEKTEEQLAQENRAAKAAADHMPMFDGVQVVQILEDGREIKNADGEITHYHCLCEDRSTRHVPVELFKN